MSKTHRRHESVSRQKRRGPKNRPIEDVVNYRTSKPHKQRRPNERAKLRKEYL